MDNTSLGVLTTLGIDLLGGVLIALAWLLIRKCRGDQKIDVDQDGPGATSKSNMNFHETVVADWSKKDKASVAPKATPKYKNRNVPGTKTMQLEQIHEFSGSNHVIATHSSNFFRDKEE